MNGPKSAFVIAITTALIAALLLIACGHRSARLLDKTLNVRGQITDAQGGGQKLTGPPSGDELDAGLANRHVTAFEDIPLLGADYDPTVSGTTCTQADALEVEGSALNLRATEEGTYTWAVFSNSVIEDQDPLELTFTAEVCKVGGGRDDEIPLSYYLGLYDYSDDAWRWFGSYGETDYTLMLNTASLQQRFKSANGNVYWCVLTAGAGKAASALPADGFIGPLPFAPKETSALPFEPSGVRILQIIPASENGLITSPAWVKNLVATPTEEGVHLSWDKAPGLNIVEYEIHRRDLDEPLGSDPTYLERIGELIGVIDVVANPDTFDFWDKEGFTFSTPPVPGKHYFYTVIAVKQYGHDGEKLRGKGDTVRSGRLLAAPTGVTASDGSYEDYVRVQWEAVDGAVNGYRILNAAAAGGPYSEVVSVDSATLSYDDTSPALGQFRWYKVFALGEDFAGPAGGPDIGFRAQLDPVQAVATDGGFPDKVVIVWGAETDSGLQYYKVYSADDDTGTNLTLIADMLPPTQTMFAYTSGDGCPWNSPKFFVVTSFISGFEQPINYAKGDFGHRALATPQGLTATEGTGALVVSLAWEPVNHASRYRIFRSETQDDPMPDLIGEVIAPITSFDDTTALWGGTEGVHYYYRVMAFWSASIAEHSEFSNEAQGWRGIGVPQNVLASDGTYPDQVAVSWDTVPQAVSYRIYGGSEAPYGVVSAPMTVYYDTGVTSGQDYTYTVSACIADGEGAQSAPDTGFANQPPVITEFTATPSEGDAPLEVTFNVTANDPEGGDLTYDWDWESDGTWDAVSDDTDPTQEYIYNTGGEFNCSVKVTDSSGGSEDAGVAVSVYHWKQVIADDDGDVGTATTLAVVNGRPAIGYYDVTNEDLKYVRALDAIGSTWGTPVTLDGTSTDVGSYTSMQVVNGNPAIGYFDATNCSLKYIRANDSDGNSWGTPISVDGSPGDPKGQYVSLCVVNDRPAMSFHQSSLQTLEYVRANDANGSSWGTTIKPDPFLGLIGEYTSLQIVNGNPAISHYQVDNPGLLRYVRASDANGSTWNDPQGLDSGSDTGIYSSLYVVNGNPAVCYMKGSCPSYIRAKDINGDLWNSPHYIDMGAAPLRYMRLSVFDGRPIVVSQYGNFGTQIGDIFYVRSSDENGETWGSYTTIAQRAGHGQISLQIVNGYPAVSYYCGDNHDLMYTYYTCEP